MSANIRDMRLRVPGRSPFDVPHEKECRTCAGKGYTAETARGPNWPGSGCPICLGTGRMLSAK